MARMLFDFVLRLARHAAMEDLKVTLPAARAAARLLYFTARDDVEREVALNTCHAMEYAVAVTRCGGRGPVLDARATEEVG